ncbi:MAG: DUF2442 domain-containing protein [Verrucomicrobiia bacterium]
MYWSVKSAKYLDGYRVAVTFADGQSGVVDLEKHLRQGPVFKRLLNVKVFKQFRINPDFGVICWGDDLDIAPETLYKEATGGHAAAKVAEAKGKYAAKRKN